MRIATACLVFLTLLIGIMTAKGEETLTEVQLISKVELLGGTVTRDETLPGPSVIAVDFEGNKIDKVTENVRTLPFFTPKKSS